MAFSNRWEMGNKTASIRANLGRAGLRALGILTLCAVVSACGVSQLTDPLQRGLFGSGEEEQQGAAEQEQTTPATLAEASQADAADAGNGLVTGSISCPSLNVSAGERTITFHAPGGANDTLSVMHRGEITKTARECGSSPSGLRVKYGFSGRVLLGPKGKPGSITLPAKVSVVQGSEGTVKTDNVRVVVNVPSGATTGYFSEVGEIQVPVPAGATAGSYRIYVGFDRSASNAS